MLTDPASLYAAFVAHDHRFDGRFYVGVTSTGVYCRPVCRVRTPRADNCRFFVNAAAAEAAGFRPCLRCRPELAPGQAPIDAAARLAWAAAQRIESGEAAELGLRGLAERLGVSDRHLRRVFAGAFGVTPVAYLQTQRLLLAKRLLTDSALPVTEVALAAGFASLRRFNAVFQSSYSLSPSALRRADAASGSGDDVLRFELAFRPPLDWPRLLRFLAARCLPGVEEVAGTSYRRSVGYRSAGALHAGWISITVSARRPAVVLAVSPRLLRALPQVLGGVRRLCDLDCEPQAVAQVLGALAADAPGLRVPGAIDGFELAVRAVLGQQVTVPVARTLAARLAAAFGEPIETPFATVARLFPTAARLAAASGDEIASLGMVRRRALAIPALAHAVASGQLDLGPAADVPATLAQLEALPGIGRWTAQYVAMRALGWPDAWPEGDRALATALAAVGAGAAEVENWRPWRSYATVHLWRRLAETKKGEPA